KGRTNCRRGSKSSPTKQVSDIELENTMDQNPDDEFLQVNDESENPSVSVKPETTQVSHTEVMDVRQADAQDELQKVSQLQFSNIQLDGAAVVAVVTAWWSGGE
nr:probable protein phosphatase 2C 62 [Tanacetum cinerariifolium]